MDIDKLLNYDDFFVREYCLIPDLYEPIVKGEVNELRDKLEKLQFFYPRVAEVFLKIFNKNSNKHQFLEDWLIIIPYQFIWNNNEIALCWFENIFNELAINYPTAWTRWVNELSSEVLATTNAICDRIYDYLSHLYAAVYCIGIGFSDLEFPLQKDRVDITACFNGKSFAIESKRIKTSKKFTSFFWRVNRALKDGKIHDQLLLSESFKFPASECIKSLAGEHCLAIKSFVKEVLDVPDCKHKAYCNGLVFEYSPWLPSAIEIGAQKDFAINKAIYFFNNVLSKNLDVAANQLAIYENSQKILFLGIQLDSLFLMDWSEEAITEQKLLFALKAHYKYDIRVIFSEDVGFSFARYL